MSASQTDSPSTPTHRARWLPYALVGGAAVAALVVLVVLAQTAGVNAPLRTVGSLAKSVVVTEGKLVSTTIGLKAGMTVSPSLTTLVPARSEKTPTTPSPLSTTVPVSASTTVTNISPTTTAVPTTTTTRLTTTTTAQVTTTTALKTATITVTNSTATYSGSAQHPTASTSPAGLAVKYSSQPTNASGYTITITITSAGTKSTSFTIGKAGPTISVSGWTGTYDGNPHGAVLNYARGVKGETLSGVNLGATFTAVGSHIATWSYPGNANYNSDSRSVTITINDVTTTT